jgi:hypothetical protein
MEFLEETRNVQKYFRNFRSMTRNILRIFRYFRSFLGFSRILQIFQKRIMKESLEFFAVFSRVGFFFTM